MQKHRQSGWTYEAMLRCCSRLFDVFVKDPCRTLRFHVLLCACQNYAPMLMQLRSYMVRTFAPENSYVLTLGAQVCAMRVCVCVCVCVHMHYAHILTLVRVPTGSSAERNSNQALEKLPVDCRGTKQEVY